MATTAHGKEIAPTIGAPKIRRPHKKKTATKIEQVYALLEERYGEKHNTPDGDPLDGLVGTILSQATSDVNSGRAHRALRAAYPDWEAVLAAPEGELADVIRSGGLANLKARRIQETLAALKAAQGSLDLAVLDDLPLAEALAWLRRLPGVGPKTAACVLLFDLGRPALPVDTHVHRVAKRLGLIGPKVSAERAHSELQAQLEPDQIYEFHLNMIAHGRRICRAPLPRCGLCPLQQHCSYRQSGGASTKEAMPIA